MLLTAAAIGGLVEHDASTSMVGAAVPSAVGRALPEKAASIQFANSLDDSVSVAHLGTTGWTAWRTTAGTSTGCVSAPLKPIPGEPLRLHLASEEP